MGHNRSVGMKAYAGRELRCLRLAAHHALTFKPCGIFWKLKLCQAHRASIQIHIPWSKQSRPSLSSKVGLKMQWRSGRHSRCKILRSNGLSECSKLTQQQSRTKFEHSQLHLHSSPTAIVPTIVPLKPIPHHNPAVVVINATGRFCTH